MLIPFCKKNLKKYRFLKDTTYFQCKLNDITHLVTPESLSFTMDVNSLYTYIPHSDGVKECRSILSINTTDQTLINDIPTLVDFILKQSFCVWRQTVSANQWHSHGKKMAPTYANIFMHYVYKKLFLHLIYNQLRISDISMTFF